MDRIVVTASREAAREVGGSVTFLDEEALETFAYTDVNRVLRQVPGVYLQEEEGFGLRPNIAIRGSGGDRNGKISVMEDGVLIAPAPYAAPAAYYFPRLTRMSGVEVVKGPAAIKYGPSTTGGALNLFSTPIPDHDGRLGGRFDLLGGEYGTTRAYGHVGGWLGVSDSLEAGILLEGLSEGSDGFKRLDSGGGTGYDITDGVLKLGLRSASAARLQQSLELKLQRYDETSDETYLGLTLADFRADPYRRYRGSQLDQMNVGHTGYQLSHRIQLSPVFDLTTVAYRNETSRAWYKLNDVLDGGAYRGISAVLDAPELYPDALATLIGEPGYTSPPNALRVRNNNRQYVASGIQSVLGAEFQTGSVSHELELSARYHEDEEDRFQQDDRYQMIDGRMVRTTAGAPGSQENRLGEARAWAFYVRDVINWGRLTLVPGLRHETIDLTRTDYVLGDASRATPRRVIDSEVDAWIPGVSATWRLNDDLRLLGGLHKGFSSPGPGSDADVESSWSYEAGLRYARGPAEFEAVGFFNDYENLVGACTNSTGGGCNIGDQFDGGEVDVKGVEVTGTYDLGEASGWAVSAPLSVVYTYTDAAFQTSFSSDYDPWGTVEAGDQLPYVPDHQLTFNAGVVGRDWRVNASANYVSEARAEAGQGAIPDNRSIDARWLLDLAGEYAVTPRVSLFASMLNVTDEVYNVAFSPAGARPGAPRLAMGGVKLRF